MTLGPLVKEVTVEAPPEVAFRRFTAEIGTWWPTATHSVSEGTCRDVRFDDSVGGRLLEEADDGTIHVWGTVVTWEPPMRVAFTWHPGRDPGSAQRVDVSFQAQGGHTRVRLTHTGWEQLGEGGHKMRDGYDKGWEEVLGLYRESVPLD